MDLAKAVVGLLVGVFFWIGVAAGGAGVFAFDRHPAWDFTVPAPVRWVLPAGWKHPSFVGLAAERDQQKARADAIAAQLDALQQQSAAKVAHAEQIAHEAQVSARKAQARGHAVLAVPRQDDACKFAKAVDAAFMEGLGQ